MSFKTSKCINIFRPYYFRGLFWLILLTGICKCAGTQFCEPQCYSMGLVRKMCSLSFLILVQLALISTFQTGSLPEFIWVEVMSLTRTLFRSGAHSVAPVQGKCLLQRKMNDCHCIFTRLVPMGWAGRQQRAREAPGRTVKERVQNASPRDNPN